MNKISSEAISIKHAYDQKKILLIGGLGFIGKVILTLFLQELPNIDRIFLLVRAKDGKTAKQRFTECLETSPVFDFLRIAESQNFNKFIHEHVSVVDGDACFPQLGLSESTFNELKQDIDLVINSAGLVDFNPDLRNAIEANVQSTIYAAEFVIKSKKASLLQVSTCYVAGNKSGIIPEDLLKGIAPNGKHFDAVQELKNLQDLIENIKQKISDPEKLKDALTLLGKTRSEEWGWSNTYTFTKALAESWLELQKSHLRFTIVRPSIVEGAVEFPFSGWNEGYNTIAPLVYLAGDWYPFCIAKKENLIDIVPVDFVCKMIVKVGAALMNDTHANVYQCALSARNKLTIEQLMIFLRKWYRTSSPSSFKNFFKYALNMRAVSPNHPLWCTNLTRLCGYIPQKIFNKSRFLRKTVRKLRLIDKTYAEYLPFSYYNNYIFESNFADQIVSVEPEFHTDIEKLNWEHYWTKIQLPGVERWCFSKVEK